MRDSSVPSLGWRTIPLAAAAVAWLAWLWTFLGDGGLRAELPLWGSALILLGVACLQRFPIASGGTAGLLALAISAVGWIPRLLSQGREPYGISLDEAMFALNGLDTLRDRPWEAIHGIDTPAIPYLGEVLQALPALIGEPIRAVRWGSLVQGWLAIAFTFCLARRLFGSVTAVAAAAFLSGSFWHMVYSTLGLPMMQPVLATVAATYLLVRGDQDNHPLFLYLGGIALAVAMLLYTPSRIALPIFLLWWCHRWWMSPPERRKLQRQLAIIVAAAALFLSPHLAHYGTGVIAKRYSEVFAVRPDVPASSSPSLTGHLGRALGIYFRGPVMVMADGYTRGPLLDPLSLGLALLGLLIALRSSRQASHFLVWTWVALVFALGQLMTDLPDSAYRAAPMLPAVAIAVGIGFERMTRRFRSARLRVACGIALIAIALPVNWMRLQRFFAEFVAGSRVARLFAIDDHRPVYYVLTPIAGVLDPIHLLAADRREAYAVTSLTDLLAQPLPPERTIVFLLEPEMRGAAEAILNCYPGAVVRFEGPVGAPAGLGLWLSPQTVAAGVGCNASARIGLRAKYYVGPSTAGPLVQERLESWPVRYTHEVERYQVALWTGSLEIQVAGKYQFLVQTNLAHADVRIGTEPIPARENRWVQLSAGSYPVRMECRPESAGGSCQLLWQPPGGKEMTLIPPSVLRPEG